MGLIPVLATLDAIIVLSRLDRDLLLSGACLGGAAFVYLTLNYAFSQLWETIPLKEITVGFLFAAGTLLVLVASQCGNAISTEARENIRSPHDGQRWAFRRALFALY